MTKQEGDIQVTLLFVGDFQKRVCRLFKTSSLLDVRLQVVCALYELAHSPYCTYVQVIIKNHEVGILVLLQ